MISVVPRTRVETISSPSTSSVTAGPPVRITSISAWGNPRIAGRSESLGSMQVTTTILGNGRSPTFRYFLAYVWFAFSALSIRLIAISKFRRLGWPEQHPVRVHPPTTRLIDCKCGAVRATMFLARKLDATKASGRRSPVSGQSGGAAVGEYPTRHLDGSRSAFTVSLQNVRVAPG